MPLKSTAKRLRSGRRVSITIYLSDNEEKRDNKRRKKFHDRPSKTHKSIEYYAREEESETEEESGDSEDESLEKESSEKETSDDEEWIDEMIDEPKKYIDADLKIRTRNPPKSLANVMKLLTDAQIDSLKDMGFKSFIGYKISRFPTALARWLLLNYNPVTSVLHAGDVTIKITRQIVHDIFGLPIGGEEIEELNQAKKTDIVIDEWRKQFHGSNDAILPSNIAKQIIERKDDAGRIFKLNFLVLFVTQMMETAKIGTVNQKFLTCLKEDTDIKKLDWFEYLLRCLKKTRKAWKGSAYNGPSTFLTVLYAQSLKPIVVKRLTSAIITKWTSRQLILFQKEIIVAHKNLKDSEVNTTPIKDRMTRKKIREDIIAGKTVKPAETLGIDNNKQDDA